MLPTVTPALQKAASTVDQLAALGSELNTNQYRAVVLAARYDDERQWFYEGHTSAAASIARRLQIQTCTAREWVRIGHALRYLPLIDAAFASNDISYAKARTLTRWADAHNEQELLDLAQSRSANRLTAAIAKALHHDDDNRDLQHHEDRSVTSYTDGDGMVVIRAVLPPSMGKPVLAAIDELVRRIAQTPADTRPAPDTELEQVPASGDAPHQQRVSTKPQSTTVCEPVASADGGAVPASPLRSAALSRTLRELRQRWQPGADDACTFPTVAQQRADAFATLFLKLDIHLTTEVVIHIRGDGNTFNDGTPITTNAITRQLPDAFIRLMIHDTHRAPADASNRRRHPTTRQKRIAMEAHNHQCVDCGGTSLLELDHNPPFHQTQHTVTTELEPRCAPCHRTRHRVAA